MRLYELVVVLRSSLSEGDRKKVIAALKDLLKEVKITKEDEWGQKPLAYKIKKELAGVYHLFHIEAENGLGIELEKKITRNDSIIRHLLVRTK
ncbi:MAG: 30S ribosomal protein S6 [Candidatus Levybacteria bacterium]|nr:30S ribosomal protein S6 [Candidatus Levybacteria bacterium]